MIEVEVKAKIQDRETIKQALIKRNATPLGTEVQRDHVYGFEGDFPPRDGGVIARIREKNGTCVLEFKEINRKIGGVELAFAIPEVAVYDAFLAKLRLKHFFTMDKTRESYALDGFTICLDQVKELGEFIEVEKMIESESLKEKTRKECEMFLEGRPQGTVVLYADYGNMICKLFGISSKKGD